MAAVEMDGIRFSLRRGQGQTLSVRDKIQGAVFDVGKPGLVENHRPLTGMIQNLRSDRMALDQS